MLPEPPCIEGLIGCPGPRNGAISSTLGSSNGTSGTSNTSGTSGTATTSSTHTAANDPTVKNVAYTSYTVTARNTGRSVLSSIVLKQGSLPSGVKLDTGRSTPGCKQVDTNVECTVDLSANQSKYLTLVYVSDDGAECANMSALKNVSVSSGSGSSNVKTSVSCVTLYEKRTIQPKVATNTGSQTNGTVIAANGSIGTAGTNGIGSAGATGFASIVDASGTKPVEGYKPGYKPVPAYPRTGAASVLFENTVEGTLRPVLADSDSIGMLSIATALLLVAFIAFAGNYVRKHG